MSQNLTLVFSYIIGVNKKDVSNLLFALPYIKIFSSCLMQYLPRLTMLVTFLPQAKQGSLKAYTVILSDE